MERQKRVGMVRWIRPRALGVFLAALAFLGVGALPAAAERLALLRIESLDALFRDARVVAEAAGKPLDPGVLEAQLLGLLGVTDGSVLDRGRPILVLLPLEGMMRKERGLVAAVPVREPARAPEVLAQRFAGHELEGDIHVYRGPEGPALYAKRQGSSLLLGASRDLLESSGADLARAATWDGPRGTVALELVLEPLMPLIEAGLMGAKDQFRGQLRKEAAKGEHLPLNPESIGAVTDLYIDMLRDVIVQVARVQGALGVSGDHLRFAKRLVPRQGTTMAAFAAAQTGGWPEGARLVDADGSVVAVSNTRLTTPVRLAFQDFLRRYLAVAGSLLEPPTPPADGSAPGNADGPGAAPDEELAAFMQSYLAASGELLERSLACMRGDFASAMDLTGKGGLSFVSAVGHTGAAGCAELVQDGFRLLDEKMGSSQEAGRFIRFEETEVAGAPAMRTSVEVLAFQRLSGESDPQAEELVRQLYGGEEATFYTTERGSLYVQTGGRDAVSRLEGALRRQSDPTAAGITPELFAPLEPGPGSFALIRIGRFLEFGRSVSPEEEGAEGAQLASAVAAFSGPAGRIPMAVTLDARGPTFQVAVPLEALRAGAALKASNPEGQAGKPGGSP